MAKNPFSYFRGGAAIMANDLATTPITGLKVQACGDAHIGNFGGFATPERRFIFDLNDFDETLPGPWEWDVKRLATSVVLAARLGNQDKSMTEAAVKSCVNGYRTHLQELSHIGFLEVFLERFEMEQVLNELSPEVRINTEKVIDKQAKRDHSHALRRLTTEVNGRWRILDDPPLVEHTRETRSISLITALYHSYRSSLAPNIARLLDHYRLVDIARRVVGVGSVGTRCWVAVLAGSEGEPLFLQVKEAMESVLEPYVGPSQFKPGERVVTGQRLLQSASDLFLGWGEAGGRSFYVRQLWDRKVSPDLEAFDHKALGEYARICGKVLARAHARTGDAAYISGYLGSSETFDASISNFAHEYSNQVEIDFQNFLKATDRK